MNPAVDDSQPAPVALTERNTQGVVDAKWYSILPVLFGVLSLGVTMTSVMALETWIVSNLHVGHAYAGLTQTVFTIGSLLSALAAGRLIGSRSPRLIGIAALLSIALGSVIAIAPFPGMLLLGRLFAGLGMSGAAVFFNAVIMYGYPKQQVRMFSFMHVGWASSAALNMAIARPICRHFGHWQLDFVLAALLTVPAIVATALVPLPEFGKDEGLTLASTVASIRKPVLVAMLILGATYNSAEQSASLYLAAFAHAVKHINSAYATEIAAMMWLGMIVGRIASARLGSFWPPRIGMLGGLAATSALFLLAVVIPDNRATAALVLGGGLFLGPVVPYFYAYLAELAPGHRNTAACLATMVACLGSALGTYGLGALADHAGLSAAIASGFAILLLGGLGVASASNRGRSIT